MKRTMKRMLKTSLWTLHTNGYSQESARGAHVRILTQIRKNRPAGLMFAIMFAIRCASRIYSRNLATKFMTLETGKMTMARQLRLLVPASVGLAGLAHPEPRRALCVASVPPGLWPASVCRSAAT